ncbi:dipeptidase PepE [Microbacterium sp.]|uniref:dipeptidase PepE n=1 Tax=Microbacterium sp. TaxID=51671 RepID=UPI002810B43C|nr:dipeptidase PepE [Microbacterium sp.]
MNLLLLSNSTNVGLPYLDHAWHVVLPALDGIDEIVFVPYALADHDAYTAKVREAFAAHGIAVRGAHESASPAEAVSGASAVFVGGGNTFRLLENVVALGLDVALRTHADAGRPYLSASAGTNLAAPSIRTTNDMPIVFPGRFEALGLVPFQINCHYLDADPSSTHAGETRALRLAEYLEENETPVVALREGTWIRVREHSIEIGGEAVSPGLGPALLFARGQEPQEISGDITSLVQPTR